MIVPIAEELTRTRQYQYSGISNTMVMIIVAAAEYDQLRAERDRYRRALDEIVDYGRGRRNGWIIRALPFIREMREIAADALLGLEKAE